MVTKVKKNKKYINKMPVLEPGKDIIYPMPKLPGQYSPEDKARFLYEAKVPGSVKKEFERLSNIKKKK